MTIPIWQDIPPSIKVVDSLLVFAYTEYRQMELTILVVVPPRKQVYNRNIMPM